MKYPCLELKDNVANFGSFSGIPFGKIEAHINPVLILVMRPRIVLNKGAGIYVLNLVN